MNVYHARIGDLISCDCGDITCSYSLMLVVGLNPDHPQMCYTIVALSYRNQIVDWGPKIVVLSRIT